MKAIFYAVWMAVMGCTVLCSNAVELVSSPSVEFTNGTQAIIRWTTDVSSGTRVSFGESETKMTRRVLGEQGKEHWVVLPSLEPGTKWAFSVGTARVPLATNSFSVPGKITRERSPPMVAGAPPATPRDQPVGSAPPTRQTWAYLPSLPDHFARHGRDFHARDADDYARMAWEFKQRAKLEALPTKVDSEGVMRIYDPKSGAFAAYNEDGTTKTFFKANSRDYFDRQPGKLIRPKERN